MSKLLQSFLSFNRTERRGIIGLLGIILLIIAFQFAKQHFVPERTIVPAENSAGTKWREFKSMNNK